MPEQQFQNKSRATSWAILNNMVITPNPMQGNKKGVAGDIAKELALLFCNNLFW
jgi:hypothetical protein